MQPALQALIKSVERYRQTKTDESLSAMKDSFVEFLKSTKVAPFSQQINEVQHPIEFAHLVGSLKYVQSVLVRVTLLDQEFDEAAKRAFRKYLPESGQDEKLMAIFMSYAFEQRGIWVAD